MECACVCVCVLLRQFYFEEQRFLTPNRGPGYVKDAELFSHLPWQTLALK